MNWSLMFTLETPARAPRRRHGQGTRKPAQENAPGCRGRGTHGLPGPWLPGTPAHSRQRQRPQLQHPILEQSLQHCTFGAPNPLASLNDNRQMKRMFCSGARHRRHECLGDVAFCLPGLAGRSEQPSEQVTPAFLGGDTGLRVST